MLTYEYLCSNLMCSFRDSVTNTSGLTLKQLSAFKNLEEITGTCFFAL